MFELDARLIGFSIATDYNVISKCYAIRTLGLIIDTSSCEEATWENDPSTLVILDMQTSINSPTGDSE